MKALELFSRCRNGAADIERMRKQLSRRQDIAAEVGMTEDDNAVILGLIEAIAARTEQRRAELSAACRIIEQLPELDGDILYWFYVERYTLEAIASANGYTKRYVQRVKQRAELTVRALSEDDVAAMLPEGYGGE